MAINAVKGSAICNKIKTKTTISIQHTNNCPDLQLFVAISLIQSLILY
jgi:hypothetical protein